MPGIDEELTGICYAASGSRAFSRRVTQQLPDKAAVKKIKIVLVGDSQVGKTRLFYGLLSRPMPTEDVPTTAGTNCVDLTLIRWEEEK